ncbi:hypothetical protein STEG23_023696, partial [Scotinomys teguina]
MRLEEKSHHQSTQCKPQEGYNNGFPGKNYINNVYPFAFDKFRENGPIFILS